MSFLDDDDTTLFASRHGDDLSRQILRVKRNDPAVRCLRLNNVYYSPEAWRRLGHIVGPAEHLEDLNISHGNLDVSDLAVGLRSNRRLRRLDFLGIDLRNEEDMRGLARFLKGNPRLGDVTLAACNLGSASFDVLSEALASCSLERVNLCCNYLGDIDLDGLVRALSKSRNLTSLRMSGCGIGRNGCASLSKLLGKRNSSLVELRLNINSIDDDCVVLLANSLSKNARLKDLGLAGNLGGVTACGWSAFLKLVCNTSDVDSVVASNHTLRGLGTTHADLVKAARRALSADDAHLLRASLEANGQRDKNTVARRKILWGHARGEIDLGDSSVHTGAVPRLLAWLGGDDSREADGSDLVQYHDPPLPKARTDAIKLDSIYRIVRRRP